MTNETKDTAFLIGEILKVTTWLPKDIILQFEEIIREAENLRKKYDRSQKLIRELLETLDRIRTIDAPIFNGETVTTINPYAQAKWQVIAEEAIKRAEKSL